MLFRKRRRKPVKGKSLPKLADLSKIIAGLETRVSRLEKDGRRAIGFHTDCVSTIEVPDPVDDENESRL